MSPDQRSWPAGHPTPSLMWMGEEGAAPLGAYLSLRPVLIEHTAHVFAQRGGVFVGIGTDGRPSSVMLFHSLSARAALRLVRELAEGSSGESPEAKHRDRLEPEPAFLPLDASPALWAWLCAALGDVCARLTPVDDEWLGLPTAAA